MSEPTFDLDAFIASYRPRYGRSAEQWATTADFVRAQLRRLPLDKRQARFASWAFAGLAAYAVISEVPLEPELVFDPRFVERYISVGWEEPGQATSRGTARACLRRWGPRLTKKAPWVSPAPAFGRSAHAVPYTRDVVEQLWDAAATQVGVDRHKAEILLGFGVGCGLDGRWVCHVKPQDVWADDEGLHVRVAKPDRIVTCYGEYEDRLSTALRAYGFWATGNPFVNSRALNAFTTRVNRRLGSRPIDLPRLRATWLVIHLTIGTPMASLLKAGGLSTTGGLRDLCRHLSIPTDGQMARALRGD